MLQQVHGCVAAAPHPNVTITYQFMYAFLPQNGGRITCIVAVLLNPEHTLRKLSCLSALFRLFLGPLEANLLDVSSDIYPEPSGGAFTSSQGREVPLAERMRSTKSWPGATSPEAIL